MEPIRQEGIAGQVLWRPSAGNPKLEIRNKTNGCQMKDAGRFERIDLKKQSQFISY